MSVESSSQGIEPLFEKVKVTPVDQMISSAVEKQILSGKYDAAPRAARSMLLQQVTFAELWQVAVQLEPQAAYLAALLATAPDIAQLAANVDRLTFHHKKRRLNAGACADRYRVSCHRSAPLATRF